VRGVRWQDIPADFKYPLCKVCEKPTPVFSKEGKRIPHCKRLTAKTCGDPYCRGVMIGRPKIRGKYKPKTVAPVVITDLDIAFQSFNFKGSSIKIHQ